MQSSLNTIFQTPKPHPHQKRLVPATCQHQPFENENISQGLWANSLFFLCLSGLGRNLILQMIGNASVVGEIHAVDASSTGH